MNTNQHVIEPKELLNAPRLNVQGLKQDIGRTIIIAPHPDDEVLGCGGLIRLLSNQETEVHVVFVTNGGASHPNSKKYPPEKLEVLRRSEALKSCSLLGVPNENVHFLGFMDSKLHDLSDVQEKEFINQLNAIFEICPFDSLATTWRLDAHSDHRATYQLCSQFVQQLKRSIQMIEYPIWLWKNGKPEDWPTYDEVEPFRLDVSEVREKKEEAIFAHQSQTTRLIDDDPEGFILTEDLLEPFMTDYEYYLFTIDSAQPTLTRDYFRNLYTESPDPWDFRTSTYERKKYLKTLEYLKYYRFENALEIGCSIGEHTNLLARHCDTLTAIDISQEAIETAKDKYGDKNIVFRQWNVSNGLPEGEFDLITLCEVGYYLNKKDLAKLFLEIDKKLISHGMFLMVHWTSYVREYPLTGRQVHSLFENLNENKLHYTKKTIYTHSHYELILWQKTK